MIINSRKLYILHDKSYKGYFKGCFLSNVINEVLFKLKLMNCMVFDPAPL